MDCKLIDYRSKLIFYSSLFIILVPLIATFQANNDAIRQNKDRYSRDSQNPFSGATLEDFIELSGSTIPLDWTQRLLRPRSIASQDNRAAESEEKLSPSQSKLVTLDDEDYKLLDKFYQTTEQNDPSLNEIQDQSGKQKSYSIETPKLSNGSSRETNRSDATSDWTIDSDFVQQNAYTIIGEGGNPNYTNVMGEVEKMAEYSPSIRLLTSYKPMTEVVGEDDQTKGRSLLLGSTLYGEDMAAEPEVKSRLASQAISLHNDLMRKPARDGKVRVRMYYHQAIHDDTKLYGTGPWKYWGHGWGLEFGYDPKSSAKNRDFYQRGYTLERAFGRDFCKDSKNCRKSDPEFFKDARSVGKYTIQSQNSNSDLISRALSSHPMPGKISNP